MTAPATDADLAPSAHSVLLADGHPARSRRLSAIVAAEADFDVIGTADDGASALTLIRELRPALAVLGVTMPRLGGIGVLKAVARDAAPPRVILLASMIADRQVLDAVGSGAWGIVLEGGGPEALIDCLRAVVAGQRLLSMDLVETAFGVNAEPGSHHRAVNTMLTARERDIAMLVCEGHPNSMIAATLGLSAGTVRIHLHNIYTKLNIRNRTALAALVLNEGGV